MLKQTVNYTDFDDNECSEVLYFNLTKTELTENMSLKDELEKIQEDFTGDKARQLEEHEIRRILDLVKTFMRLSYGIRSADGKRFVKTPDIWEEFTQTAAYDAFLFGLFETPSKALEFMTGILPKDLRAAAIEAAKKEGKGDILRDMQALELDRKLEAETAEVSNVVSIKKDVQTEKPILGPNPTQEELQSLVDWMAANPE